ncbi:response regulator [Parafilimonas sp.]|uniref:response regulator n=1 Tax=Parafilimonas sp. TaxID=1969739 RepID=UPI0039E5AE43
MFRKVLLVDDDAMVITIYERLITVSGFASEVIAKNNGEQAKEFLLQNKPCLPDIIFVDLCMSVMDGPEFIRWFEEWQQKDNIQIPVYVLSSSMSAYDYNLISKSRISGFIVKPLTARYLKEITAKHLNKSQHFLKLC